MITEATIDQPATPEVASKRELERQVGGLYDAWRDRDEARVRTFFSDRGDLKLWGTDHFERIVGRAEADRDFRNWIAACPPWTSIAPTHRVLDVRDGLAWVADDLEGRWAAGAESGVEHFRMTTVWEASDGTWRVVHANLASAH
jgi:hypothetical protein